MAITLFSIGSTLVAAAAIQPGHSLTRRQREREAVSAIVRSLFGAQASINHDINGAPTLEGWHISVSHSALIAAVAVDKHAPIGIDAEEWREALSRVASRFLTPDERAAAGDSREALLRAWGAKEAVYKASGIRLLASGEIHLSPSFLRGDRQATATAAGEDYSLTATQLGETSIVLARKL